jgi:hypothetical protein
MLPLFNRKSRTMCRNLRGRKWVVWVEAKVLIFSGLARLRDG